MRVSEERGPLYNKNLRLYLQFIWEQTEIVYKIRCCQSNFILPVISIPNLEISRFLMKIFNFVAATFSFLSPFLAICTVLVSIHFMEYICSLPCNIFL